MATEDAGVERQGTLQRDGSALQHQSTSLDSRADSLIKSPSIKALKKSPTLVAQEEVWGAEALAAAQAGKQIVFSYASPQALKQAKLEALQLRCVHHVHAGVACTSVCTGASSLLRCPQGSRAPESHAQAATGPV